MREPLSNKHKTLITGIAAFVLLSFCVGGIILYGRKNNEIASIPDETTTEASSADTTSTGPAETTIPEPVLRQNIETVLYMGVDSTGEVQASEDQRNNGAQADSIMLFVIDHENESYNIIQINRDTMTEMDTYGLLGDFTGTRTQQIALSHSYGTGLLDSCHNTRDAVEHLLNDIDIDHVISLSMDCIDILNDSVGGVTVTIPYDMTAANPEFIEGTTITLHDGQAEQFVRARMSLPAPYNTNIERMARQRTFMEAWRQLAAQQNNDDPQFALNLIGVLSDYMVSDMNVSQLSNLADVLSNYEAGQIIPLQGESVASTYMEFYPDQDFIDQTVNELFYEAA